MNKINNINNIIIPIINENKILNNYSKYNYDDEDIFNFHLDFVRKFYDFEIINNIENSKDFHNFINLINHQGSGRVEAKDWPTKVKELYNNKCILSGKRNAIQACHIIELKDKEDKLTHSIYNGLCLDIRYHYFFDQYYWTINPVSLMVEISDNYKDKDEDGDLEQFRGKKIDINNIITIKALQYRYNKFNKN
jgi:hypothetical protein